MKKHEVCQDNSERKDITNEREGITCIIHTQEGGDGEIIYGITEEKERD